MKKSFLGHKTSDPTMLSKCSKASQWTYWAIISFFVLSLLAHLIALQKAAMYCKLSTHKPVGTMKILSIRRIQQQKENEEFNKVGSMLGFFLQRHLGLHGVQSQLGP
jgi:hypothetical protein